jgi:hypothetical protein
VNERIKELWEQCKTINWSIDNPDYDHEKFAELIVKECGLIVDELAGGQMGGASSYDLNKHFGVAT